MGKNNQIKKYNNATDIPAVSDSFRGISILERPPNPKIEEAIAQFDLKDPKLQPYKIDRGTFSIPASAFHLFPELQPLWDDIVSIHALFNEKVPSDPDNEKRVPYLVIEQHSTGGKMHLDASNEKTSAYNAFLLANYTCDGGTLCSHYSDLDKANSAKLNRENDSMMQIPYFGLAILAAGHEGAPHCPIYFNGPRFLFKIAPQ